MLIETISSLAEGNPLVVGIELLIGSIYDVDDIKMVRIYYRRKSSCGKVMFS